MMRATFWATLWEQIAQRWKREAVRVRVPSNHHQMAMLLRNQRRRQGCKSKR